jgi:hypothetical protein
MLSRSKVWRNKNSIIKKINKLQHTSAGHCARGSKVQLSPSPPPITSETLKPFNDSSTTV